MVSLSNPELALEQAHFVVTQWNQGERFLPQYFFDDLRNRVPGPRPVT